MNFAAESSSDPLEIQSCEKKYNPWAVEDVSVFLKYHCPECEFNDYDLKCFTDHALTNHENSTALFSAEKDLTGYEELVTEVEFEENCIRCGYAECICYTNEV